MSNVRTITILYVGFLVLFLIPTIVFSVRQKDFSSAGEHQDILAAYGKAPIFSLVKWDSLWYLKIAKLGYFSPESHNFAAPLFPFVIGTVNYFVGNIVLAGLLVNILLLPVLLFCLLRMLEIDFSFEQSVKVIVVFLAFPFSFFLFLPFSETLFLIFTVLAFFFTRKSRWFLASSMAFLASLSRYAGLVVFLCLFLEAVFALVSAVKRGVKESTRVFLRKAVYLLLSLVALLWVWQKFGFLDANNLAIIRDHWQLSFFPFPLFLFNAFVWLVKGGNPFIPYLFFYVLIALWLIIKHGAKLPRLYGIYSVAGFALFLSRQDFNYPIPLGTGRYLLSLFPLFIVLGVYSLSTPRSLNYYLTASLLLLAFNFALYLSNFFVG